VREIKGNIHIRELFLFPEKGNHGGESDLTAEKI